MFFSFFSFPSFLPQSKNSFPAPCEGGWSLVTTSSQRFMSISETCHFWAEHLSFIVRSFRAPFPLWQGHWQYSKCLLFWQSWSQNDTNSRIFHLWWTCRMSKYKYLFLEPLWFKDWLLPQYNLVYPEWHRNQNQKRDVSEENKQTWTHAVS